MPVMAERFVERRADHLHSLEMMCKRSHVSHAPHALPCARRGVMRIEIRCDDSDRMALHHSSICHGGSPRGHLLQGPAST